MRCLGHKKRKGKCQGAASKPRKEKNCSGRKKERARKRYSGGIFLVGGSDEKNHRYGEWVRKGILELA